MTYEEAIYCLTVMRNEVLDTWEFDFSNEETDALGLALEAMELQVAKKPHIWGDGYADGELVYDMYDCPNCDKSYELYYEKYGCCPRCGQKLDWSDWSE